MNLTVQYIIDSKKEHLAELKKRQGIVRDKIRSVACQYATGMYLYGRPGTAKTHTVRTVLENAIREPYVYQRGHITPIGLFELIEHHPEDVIVLDDLVSIFRNDVTLQILLAALEHPSGKDRSRIIRYRRQGEERRSAFRGGIICISNRELHDSDMLAAFKSRVHTLNYDPSDAQIGALMLSLAENGVGGISPADATSVAYYLLEEMLRLACRFDLRLFINKALPDYQQWRDDEAESDWRDLVTASIEEHLGEVRFASDCEPRRSVRKQEEYALIREILHDFETRDGRVRAWTERTGKSERAFYRRLAELH